MEGEQEGEELLGGSEDYLAVDQVRGELLEFCEDGGVVEEDGFFELGFVEGVVVVEEEEFLF